MTTNTDPIDAIYDAKRGCFRDLGGEPVTADNLPRKGDLLFRAMPNYIGFAKWDWSVDDMCHGDTRILRRAEQPKPDLIYFPWPSGIDGIIGVIGPRGDIDQEALRFQYYPNGSHSPIIGPYRHGTVAIEQYDGRGRYFAFPADADLTWVRDESEVPADLLREAKERDA